MEIVYKEFHLKIGSLPTWINIYIQYIGTTHTSLSQSDTLFPVNKNAEEFMYT